MKRVAIYGRISTSDQCIETQLQAIRQYCKNQEWEVVKEYLDEGISGSKDSRPALNELKEDCRKGKIKGVIVYKFDRLARSTAHLLECLTLFKQYNIDFVSVTEGIDTGTSVGKMVYTFLGAIAEFERELIKERVKAGMERAKNAGIHCGRKRVGFDLEKALELRRQGLGYKQIAKHVTASRSTLHRYLKNIPLSQKVERENK